MPADQTVGWLTDFVGSSAETLPVVWKIATGGDHGLEPRPLAEGGLSGIPAEINLPPADSPSMAAARKAILACIRESCETPLADAIAVQARHSADFMSSRDCRKGMIGTEANKVMNI